jgi:membrane protein
MGVPRESLVKKAQQTAEDAAGEVNKVDVPLTRRLGLADFIKLLFKEMGSDHVGAFAGNLAYNALFALFPFAIFLLSLLGIFHATSLVNTMISRISGSLPPDAVGLIRQNILTVAQSHASGAFTVSAIIALLLALYGVSGAFRAVIEATNVVYNVTDRRPIWKRYLISIGLALSSAILLIGALVLALFGPAIGRTVANHVGLGDAFTLTWNIVQWPVLLVFVLIAFALIYYFAPDVEQEFRFMSPGAIVAVVLWVIFSGLFSLYVNNFGSYNKTYGTLAGLVILLLFMYYSGMILLMGAEMNQIIEQHAPGGKNEGDRAPHGGDESNRGAASNHTLRILRENRPMESSEVK